MVSKCANPECKEQFRYLHQGKIFHLTPTPDVEKKIRDSSPALYERFWLCDKCCRKMTLVWGGTEAKLIPLPPSCSETNRTSPDKVEEQEKPRKRAVAAGLRRR